jgi:hypothetical protein
MRFIEPGDKKFKAVKAEQEKGSPDQITGKGHPASHPH